MNREQEEERRFDRDLETGDPPELELEPKGRYLSVHGSYIDQIGFQPHQLVTAALKLNQQVRDHYHHHITLINHLDISTLIPKQEDKEGGEPVSNKKKKKLQQKTMYKLCREIYTQFGLANNWERPIDLGMGSCQEKDAITYFRVLYWPLGQLIRHHVGLGPSHFHITVGFAPHDLHLYKGPASLLCLQEGYFCTRQQMDRLVDYAYYYSRDWAFISKLYQTCWRHCYINQGIKLSKILAVCKSK